MIYQPARKKRWKVFAKKRKPLIRYSSSFPVPAGFEQESVSAFGVRYIKILLYILGFVIAAIIVWDRLPKRIISPLPQRPPVQLFFSSRL
jgi:hypothetical protein